MTRIEKRLWLASIILFFVSLAASAALANFRGVSLQQFPSFEIAAIRRALRPDLKPMKIERASSVEGLQKISVTTTATMITVARDESLQDVSITLEGDFPSEPSGPLEIKKKSGDLTVEVVEKTSGFPGLNGFGESNPNSELRLVLPRQWEGTIELSTVSGDTEVSGLSLSSLKWSSVSGSLDAKDSVVHALDFNSTSGDIDFAGRAFDAHVREVSGDAMLTLTGLENVEAPRLNFETVSGRVDVAVSAQSSLKVSLSSVSGETASTIALNPKRDGDLEGELGAAAGEMRLRSVSGSLHVSTF